MCYRCTMEMLEKLLRRAAKTMVRVSHPFANILHISSSLFVFFLEEEEPNNVQVSNERY